MSRPSPIALSRSESPHALVDALRSAADPRLSRFFSAGTPLFVAAAPGRLDVMGGIADYSGSLVLQMPLALRITAVAQACSDSGISLLTIRNGDLHQIDTDLTTLRGLTTDEIRARFGAPVSDGWAVYVAGVVAAVLARTDQGQGLRLLLLSEVPEGKGISSSAALEVAALCATAARYGIAIDPIEAAVLCQWVENHVVGAPCGIMDQMTSALGQNDRLLRLLCRPARVEGFVSVPEGYRFFGIDSGIRHAVSGADYGTVRAAAFMGYRIVAAMAGLHGTINGSAARVHDPLWNGYLSAIGVSEFSTRYLPFLPSSLLGADFLTRYGGMTDTVTTVDPGRLYPVRAAASHPVYEHARVSRFATALEQLPEEPALATLMGRLMYESHQGYSDCGLGTPYTDRIVQLVQEAGEPSGLFGARITGGGSGGTVAIFGRTSAEPVVRGIADTYSEETGKPSTVFIGSGPGAFQKGIEVVPF